MLSENNIVPFLFLFLPALFYAALIYLSMPSKIVNLKISFLHFLMGSITVTAVMAVHWIFPHWMDPMSSNFIISNLAMAFIQVALLEEGVKLLFYRFTEMYRGRLPSPFSVMFYAMSVSAGFAVVENMTYVWRFGEDVLWTRATTAMVLHMLAGLIMGYFIAIGMYKKKKRMYRAIGLFAAVLLHGLYDFNIMVSYQTYELYTGDLINIPTGMGFNIWCVLGTGIICTVAMFLHLRSLRGRKHAAPPSEK